MPILYTMAKEAVKAVRKTTRLEPKTKTTSAPKAAVAPAKTESKAPVAPAPVARKKSGINFAAVKTQLKRIPLPHSYTPVLVVLLIIASFLLGMLVTKLQYLESGQLAAGAQPAAGTQAGNQQAPQAGAKVDVSNGDLPVMGNKNAKVKVVEFADFQCPFCKQWFSTVETSLINDYVKTGKVAFYWRDYPFLGQESNLAANAARCANEQGKFWEFHDYLYQHQGQENSGAFSADNLKQFGATLGLNTDQFNSCIDSGKYNSAAQKDLSDGQKAGVTGTPTVFINGQSVVGAQPYTAFKTLIDQELAKK